jgi:anti-sigma factor RsiW
VTGDGPIGEDDLQALIDGRLSSARLETVKAFLASNPALASQVEREIEQREALRAKLAFKAQEPIPARLRISNLMAAPRRTSRINRSAIAAAIAWLVIGGVLGILGSSWWFVRQFQEANVTENAIAAHRIYVSERLHPVEVPADQEAHLVQWLSRRVGKPLTAPNLNAQGYRLIGGRLLPSGGAAAAQFMYENIGGNRLTIYVRSDSSEAHTAFRFEEENGISAFLWIDNGLSYVVSAKADRGQLLPIAESIYKQFEATADAARGRL